MKYNLKNRPSLRYFRGTAYGRLTKKQFKDWFEGFEEELRLFIAIHENEGHKISPKLMRKEILGE